MTNGAYSEVIDVEAFHKSIQRGLWVLVDINACSHTVVLGDGARVKLLHHLSSIKVSTPDLCTDSYIFHVDNSTMTKL